MASDTAAPFMSGAPLLLHSLAPGAARGAHASRLLRRPHARGRRGPSSPPRLTAPLPCRRWPARLTNNQPAPLPPHLAQGPAGRSAATCSSARCGHCCCGARVTPAAAQGCLSAGAPASKGSFFGGGEVSGLAGVGPTRGAFKNPRSGRAPGGARPPPPRTAVTGAAIAVRVACTRTSRREARCASTAWPRAVARMLGSWSLGRGRLREGQSIRQVC
jgi:hypothetical protein